MYCDRILTSLGLTKTLEIQNHELLEGIGLEAPFYEGLGFPPALIPIASSAHSFLYTGVYLHEILSWQYAFVDLLIEESELYEIGLNESQFCYSLARRAMLDYYDEDDSEQANKIFKLCSLLGINDPIKIGTLTDAEFLQLETFRDGVPQYIKNAKPGCSTGGSGFQKHSIGVSLDTDLLSEFDKALNRRAYQCAWDILNSPGWRLDDAKLKFKSLADAVNDETLTSIYKEWVGLKHPVDGY